MNCRICNNNTSLIFSKITLGKYDVKYYKCSNCNFLQTEDPYWLNEAYNTGAISALDTGVISRNIYLTQQTLQILLKINSNFLDFKGLDYGGGEGITVRMLRDIGLNFFRYDLHAENLYARYFDLKDLPRATKFNIITAFEVFEHLIDPINEIKKMFDYSEVILFSTELQPSDSNINLFDWWYLVPEGGQHISFYDYSSLQAIASEFNAVFYTNNRNLHIFSKIKNLTNPFVEDKIPRNHQENIFSRLFNKYYKKINKPQLNNDNNEQKLTSLTQQDFEMVKKKIILSNEN